MEPTTEGKTKFFKGAGYLVGFLAGSAVAIVFVALTGIEALIGAIAGAVALPAGMVLEKKFQGEKSDSEPSGRNIMFVFIAVGVIFLVALFLFNL